MKKVSLFLSLLFLPYFLVSQEENIPLGKITFLHQTNLVSPNELNGDAILYFNQKKSVYKHLSALNEGYVKDDGVSVDKIAGDKEGFPIFVDLSKRIATYRTTLGLAKKKCVINDTLPNIDWKIFEDNRQIGKFKCKKATGEFRGRTYNVWFTLDIPISTGPYKLTGLPGLILEAKSQDGRVNFLFKKLELSSDFEYNLTKPSEKLSYNSKREYDLALIDYNQKLLKKAKSKGISLNINPPHPESKIEKEK